MRLPRDISGKQLAKAQESLGYAIQRQRGSHLTLTTNQQREHHITVPLHNPIKLGTLNGILKDVGEHHQLDRDTLLQMLFG